MESLQSFKSVLFWLFTCFLWADYLSSFKVPPVPKNKNKKLPVYAKNSTQYIYNKGKQNVVMVNEEKHNTRKQSFPRDQVSTTKMYKHQPRCSDQIS